MDNFSNYLSRLLLRIIKESALPASFFSSNPGLQTNQIVTVTDVGSESSSYEDLTWNLSE